MSGGISAFLSTLVRIIFEQLSTINDEDLGWQSGSWVFLSVVEMSMISSSKTSTETLFEQLGA